MKKAIIAAAVGVTAETQEELKTGALVREDSVQAAPRISSHMLSTVKFKGESAVVDVCERGALFARGSRYKKDDNHGADIPAIIFSRVQSVIDSSMSQAHFQGMK